MGALTSLKNVISQKGKLQLVNTLIMSKISYLLCVWGNSTENVMKKA